ncbi:MAG: signal peptidase II [Treponema sp.]|nr:signal peptidase II [Treponema sp.]
MMLFTENCKKFGLPFALTSFIIIMDQITKAYIVSNWPRIGTVIRDVFNNDFLLIYHVRNKAIAFSIGTNVPEQYRFALFVIIPLAVLALLVLYYFKSIEFTQLQRWAIAGIIGGGVGNIIDRIFREEGVVDFISVKIYGLFGMERWPTFNIADSSVVVCCLILMVSMFVPVRGKSA